jgi:hypothetical protein
MKSGQLVVAFILPLLFAGCSQVSTGPVSPQSAPNPTPEAKSKTDWNVSAPKINPMDNVSTQFVTTGDVVKLVFCFESGKLCGHGNVPVFLTSPCWIDGNEAGSYYRKMRVKFDDDRPIAENWGITDDHKALFPLRRQAFVTEVKKHRTLMVEFGCDRSDPGDVITLGVQGLQEALDSANLKLN